MSNSRPILDSRAIRPYVRVVLNAPPCEREFRLTFRANGDLRYVEIDGISYACTRLRKGGFVREGERRVTLVEVVVSVPF